MDGSILQCQYYETRSSQKVADYIEGFPRPVQTVLKRVRSIIRKAVPGAEESEPVPVKLIERIAKFRAKEVAAQLKAKSVARKKR